MARRGPALAIGAAGLAAALSACAPAGPAAAPEPAATVAGMAFRFEDVLAPAAYARSGPAVSAPAKSAAGLWAEAPGLTRAERGRVVNPATGKSVDVALYRGRGATIRLSPEAAEAIGVGTRPVPVQITALRREPRVEGPAPAPGGTRGRR
jgi:hypothetical protein